jgi:hypothetical protein
MGMESKRKQTLVRLSDDGRALLEALQQRLGLSVTGVIELAIRRLAAAEAVELKSKNE